MRNAPIHLCNYLVYFEACQKNDIKIFKEEKAMRVLLVLVDGMRPDALTGLGIAQDIIKRSTYTLEAEAVMPSVTLPCHMSLFHSVNPSRHGTTTNVYMPQVRPINGLCEVLLNSKKKSAFFYNWEELRDLSRPNSLTFSYFCKGRDIGYDKANDIVSNAAIEYIKNNYVDFAFLYLGYTDAAGHKAGWMSDEYMEAMNNSWENIHKVIQSLPEDYTCIITADHGGHDRMHGTDLPEDMKIPIIITGARIEQGKVLEKANIKDIAPTVAKLLDTEPDEEWEGISLL